MSADESTELHRATRRRPTGSAQQGGDQDEQHEARQHAGHDHATGPGVHVVEDRSGPHRRVYRERVGELRAYALAVTELRAVVGADPVTADRLRAVAHRVLGPAPTVGAPGPLGPIHRRVPGTPVVRPDDPTPQDLDALLTGAPTPPGRAAATWRLVEALATGLAWSSTVVDGALPSGLLVTVGLDLPAPEGVTLGWCPLDRAADVPGLRGWLTDTDAWVEEAERAGRARPDLVVLGRP